MSHQDRVQRRYLLQTRYLLTRSANPRQCLVRADRLVSRFLQASPSFGIADSTVSKENGSQTIGELLLQSERSGCCACTVRETLITLSRLARHDDFDSTRLLLPFNRPAIKVWLFAHKFDE